MGIRRAGTSENRLIREEKLYEKDKYLPKVRRDGCASDSGRRCAGERAVHQLAGDTCATVCLGDSSQNFVAVGLSSVPVDWYVCCCCGFSEEWLRESDLKKVKKYWKLLI